MMRHFAQFCRILLTHCIKFTSRNMATITKRGASWFAQTRRKGHKSISKSFPTKGMAEEWTRKIEREIDTLGPVGVTELSKLLLFLVTLTDQTCAIFSFKNY
jgi:hypothetical protein